MEVLVPQGEGPFPAIVTVHGGAWVIGSPALMRPLARFLTDAGYLTVNTSYQLATNQAASFPAAVDDIACAVRIAAAHPLSDGTVVLIGHSAGAHLSAIVALTGEAYGADCPVSGSGVPDGLVGLGGPYDIRLLGLGMLPFFGVDPDSAPEVWLAGNPQLLTDSNPGLTALIIHGGEDTVVELHFADEFHRALVASGANSSLEVVSGADHGEITDPIFVGDLILGWMDG